ncbi:hypothetical protein DDQ50_14725 [Amnibacterium flavum]|uniref:Uncharacterized protein n=1 Tax=Amnibacterium flavum TaxID=2173173 RepID=A0A2V1HRA9_9MICO|nr:hypothetical protein DDQ50_14725 [Amnibacterium flavum]
MARRGGDRVLRFRGRIAGTGTTSGVRVVVGLWEDSPYGAFADVMAELESGHRILFAPTPETAELISSVYSFDEVVVSPVSLRRSGRTLRVETDRIRLELGIGRVSALGILLRMVPRPVATSWRWAAVVDPIARVLVRGARTAGSAGGGRREYYGVSDARRILSVTGALDGVPLGAMADLSPAVRFGFASTPPSPTLVDVTTTIR